ncbi:NUDIX hydrolase [Ammoniphilus resinae]|uniref:8-oxo-dGTP pyrophosphatase MutT (NUDIX family) n=1 Tax=Ammoniphilus resinae TaxID=861532 RepID=A0ABS4GJS3_9BACL|nr:NUDIX domain-containing protein [Ammoniphilus resinae]MBP1930515.1 8-oxo-dGTP pyrophosphatase MutT (NUDIX family) [Ammoniphilus resinae]
MKEVSAGGVVYRRQPNHVEILMIEDRYMKVSLPKGKQESEETIEQTALREVREETGIEGEIREPLEVIYYQYYHPQMGQINKEVHYYLVEATGGVLVPQIEEINKVQWMEPTKAWKMQQENGYENNDSVISKAFDILGLPKEG